MVEECLAPGASVSEVALRHGVNTNQLFKWRRQHLAAIAASAVPPALIPVTIEAPACGSEPRAEAAPSGSAEQGAGSIEIELSGARIRLHGSVDPKAIRTVVAALMHR